MVDGRALLIEDVIPWSLDSDYYALGDAGIDCDVIQSSDLAGTSLAGYRFVMYSSDQPTSYYQNIDANQSKISAYVASGGTLLAHATDWGWSEGLWDGLHILPGGVEHVVSLSQSIGVVTPAHPVLSGYAANTDYFYDWNYSAHGYFTNLVPNTTVILDEDDDVSRPVYIDYSYGQGQVLATLQPIEWGYAGNLRLRPEFLLSELRFAESGAGSRSWLIKSIRDYKTRALDAFDQDVELTASEYELGSEIRTDPGTQLDEWISATLHALNTVTTVMGKVFDVGSLFNGKGLADNTAGLGNNLAQFDALMKSVQEGAAFKTLAAEVFTLGVFGDIADLGSYDLFRADLGGFTAASDQVYKETGGSSSATEDDVRWDIMGSRGLRIPLRAGAPAGGNRATVTAWAKTPSDARARIRAELDNLIANIPDPLPANYPTQVVATRFEDLSKQLNPADVQAVEYPARVNGQIVDRRVSRGVILSYYDLNSDLTDALRAHWDVRYWESIGDINGLGLTAVTALASGASGGEAVKYVSDFGQTIAGATTVGQTEVLPSQTLSPVDALTNNAVEMTTKLPGQLGNIWASTDGLCTWASAPSGIAAAGRPTSHPAMGANVATLADTVGAGLSGHLSDSLGNPLESMAVTAYRDDPVDGWVYEQDTSTDSNGDYALDSLAPGTYRVSFSDPLGNFLDRWYRGKPSLDQADDIVLADGTDTSGIDDTLVDAYQCSAFGTVRSSASHSGLGGIRVVGYQDAGYAWVEAFETSTSASGFYQSPQLEPGTYRFSYFDPGGQYAFNEATNVVALGESSFYELPDVGLSAASHLTGSVATSGTSTLLRGMTVTALVPSADPGGGWEEVATATSDASGAFDLGGLRAGSYRVGVHDASGTYQSVFYRDAADISESTILAVAAGSTSVIGTQKMQRLASLSGTVHSGGVPRANVLVSAYQLQTQDGVASWRVTASAMTAPDGSYSILGLSPGSYRIGFHDPSGACGDLYYPSATGVSLAADVSFSPGQAGTLGDVVLPTRVFGSVSGLVTGDGSALEGVIADVYSKDESGSWTLVAFAPTDASGAYTVPGLAAGTYRVGFHDPSDKYSEAFYGGSAEASYAADVVVTGGATHSGINLGLTRSDTVPPVTSVFSVPGGWTNSPVFVSLVADDDDSGVAATRYSIGSPDDPQLYSNRVEVSAEGTTDVYYWSEDQVGNQEAKQHTQVRIDYGAPEASMNVTYVNQSMVDVSVDASDSLSGLDHVEMELDDGPWQTMGQLGVTTPGTHSVSALAYDRAGNTTYDVVDVTVVGKCGLSTPTVSGKASKKRPVVFVGSVWPGHVTAVRIEVQRSSGRKYKGYKKLTVRSDTGGRYSFKLKLKAGPYRLRASTSALGPYLASGPTGWRAVKVK